MKTIFPFTAIQGQEDFKLCLLLCMIDPTLGGVLAIGDKGTGKTTTVRGLGKLMERVQGDFPFINLPIGATEDRVLGSVRLDVLLNDKKTEVQAGLLAQAHQGILYIDEVNLLDDYLMDVLLDAASSGGYYLERDYVSQWLESKFCLVGTMNPEEGELRPQLLDRFGLSVTIRTPEDPETRIGIMKQRLLFDADPERFCGDYKEEEKRLAYQIQKARQNLNNVQIRENIYEDIAALCIKNKAEGLRADILLMKAARAYAAFQSKELVERADIEKVLAYVLNHRSVNRSHNFQSHQRGNTNPREEKEGDSKRAVMV